MPFVQRVIEPKFLSRTTLFDNNGKPRVTDDELDAVTNNTLSNALRQLASLALIADDIFVDLTKQLQNVARRSDVLKGKIGTLEEKVSTFDPKKIAVPVSDICTFARLKEHYKTQHDLATNLFNSSTRPSAVQALYEAAAKTPIPLMRQMDRWRRDGQRSSRFFMCTPVLGAKRRKIRNRIDIDIETRMPAAVEELRRWTSTEALGDITVAPDCPNRIPPNVTFSDGNITDGTIGSDDEGIDHKLPSPEEQVQVIALKFPAEIVAVDVSGRAFNRMSVQRRSLLRGDLSNRTEGDGSALRRQTRTRKPRNRRRNTLAGTDQKEIQNALTAGEEPSTSAVNVERESRDGAAVFRSKSSEPLRSSSKRDPSVDNKKSHFYTLKQWGKNRLKMMNKSNDLSKSPTESNTKIDDTDLNIYETVTVKRKRSLNREKRTSNHERKPSYSSSEKSSINLPISTPLSAAMSIAVKLRESSVQRRLRRSGGNKDEPHSSSGNWSASSESGRASIGSEITSTTTQPKSSTSTATSNNSLNLHPPSSVNSRRKFNINTSGSSSITSEGTLTPDIHDFHEDGETSSVYSCDTEGYYTSFHMDSGLKTLKEEDTPATPLHSTTAFSNSSSSNTVLTAENEYELFGKGSTSTTASSAGTVCTTLKATGSSRSLSLGPAVPERKSSLSKVSKDRSPSSSLEREFGSEKTGTVKRSPASSKSTIVAVVHEQTNGDVSPDSGHNTSSSPIESANSPNGVRSGSEFEFSECSDMEGADRIERIRIKTTINSSRIPSMCVITPPHSDDESVKSHSYDHGNNNNKNAIDDNKNIRNWKDSNRRKLNLPLKPMETDLDSLDFVDSIPKNSDKRMQVINVNPQSGYATIETINKNDPRESELPKTASSVRAPSPSGGTVTVKEEIAKPQSQPIFKATLLPFNNVFGKIKSNLYNFSKKDNKSVSSNDQKAENCDNDYGDYVTIADVRNNNEKTSVRTAKLDPLVVKSNKEAEYVSLNELPCNTLEDAPNGSSNANDSLERKRRQGARVTLDAEGKVVYSSDSLRRRKGAHTTFEPGPYVKETLTVPSESPIPSHRMPKSIRPVHGTKDQHSLSAPKNETRPLSPQMGKVVIRAGISSPTAEIVRLPPSTIVTPTMRPISPKPNNARGAYVRMQDAVTTLLPPNEKEPVYSPTEQPNACKNWVVQNSLYGPADVHHKYGYQNPLLATNIQPFHNVSGNATYTRGNPDAYRTLPCRRSQFMTENYNVERPITPDIMRSLPSTHLSTNVYNYNNSPGSNRRLQDLHNVVKLPPGQYAVPKLGIPVQVPQVNLGYKPSVPSIPKVQTVMYPQSIRFHSSTPLNSEAQYHQYPNEYNSSSLTLIPSHFKNEDPNESLKISPIDPRNLGGFQSSTPSSKYSHQEVKAAVNLESKLLSPKKSTMSTEELYAVIHKGKKKMNIQTQDERVGSPSSMNSSSPAHCRTPERVKSPETGYIGEKARSRFSWSPSDGEYVDYNTNIDRLSPSNEAGTRQSWACSDRKGPKQTSRLNFKKLLLQHSAKSNLASPGIKKISAVEQLKLSKQECSSPPQTPVNVLELSGSPKTLHNRRFTNTAPGSPKNGCDKRSMSKLLSPRSQWRFTNPRSDVLSSTIPEDCGEDESPSSSMQRKNIISMAQKSNLQTNVRYSTNSTAANFKLNSNLSQCKQNLPSVLENNTNASRPTSSNLKSSTSVAQYIRAQRAQFFSSSPTSTQNSTRSPSKDGSKEDKTCIPTLETAF